MRHRYIIDCFTFFNELKLLAFRLEELYDFVDYFVLVESTKTFTGNDKELYYQNNKHLFTKYNHKIIHVIVDDVDMPDAVDIEDSPEKSGIAWTRERFQRNAIMRGLKKIGVLPDDIILICDVDEVVSRHTIRYFRFNPVQGLYVLYLDSYIYNFENKIVSHDKYTRICTGARAVDYQSILEIGTPDKVRNQFLYNKEYYPNGAPNDRKFAWIMSDSGWHLTYFGDKNFIIKKIQSYSHQELNTSDIMNSIDEFIGSGRYLSGEYATTHVSIESNPNLPYNYRMLL